MEPEDLPWPDELEEEEEEEEEEGKEEAENASAAATEEARTSEETGRLEEEELEGAGPEVDLDFNSESQLQESTDEEEDELAKAWLQAHPDRPGQGFSLTPPPTPPPSSRHQYRPVEHWGKREVRGRAVAWIGAVVIPLTYRAWQQTSYQDNARAQFSNSSTLLLEPEFQWDPEEVQRTESWHHLPQERDSFQTLNISQTGIDRVEGAEVKDLPSQEGGESVQAQCPVKEPKLDLLCSPLLVIQDDFAAPDLPLLTCMTQDQEFEPDSLFQQSELEFAPLRGIPDKSEDIEWLARPSEVSEALIQATSESSSDLVNSCFSISQHPLTGSTIFGSQRSLSLFEQENNRETVPCNAPDDLKSPDNSYHYDAQYSYMSWLTEKDTQQPEGSLADKDQASSTTISDISDESITVKRSSALGISCSYSQYRKQEALKQTEASLASKDHASFSRQITSLPNKMSRSFLRCMLKRGEGTPLTSDNPPENVCLRTPAEDEMSQKNDSLEGYEGNEDLQKELSQYFKQKETRNTWASSRVHAKYPEIKSLGTVAIPESQKRVAESYILCRGLDISKLDTSGCPLPTVKSNFNETSEQLCFQEERNQKAATTFDEKNVDATGNVAFEAIIASIESSNQEGSVSETQTDSSQLLADDSEEKKTLKPDLSPFSCKDEISFIDKLKYQYQSTPAVFEPADSKPLLCKEDDAGSLYHYPDLKHPINVPQSMLEGLQGKAKSDVLTLFGDAKYASIYENAGAHSERITELQREVDCSNLSITQAFPSSLPSFVPQEPTIESEYHSSNLRMLRVSPDTLLTSLTQTTGSVDQKIGAAAISSPYSHGVQPGSFPQEELPDRHLTEEIRKVSPAPRPAGQKPEMPTVPSSSYSKGIKSVFYRYPMSYSPQGKEPPNVSSVSGSAENALPLTVTSVSQPQRETAKAFYQQTLSDSLLTAETLPVSVIPESGDQKTHLLSGFSLSYSHRGEDLPEDVVKVSTDSGSVDKKADIPTVSSSTYQHKTKPGIIYYQEFPDSHVPIGTRKVVSQSGAAGQKTDLSAVPSTSSSQAEKPVPPSLLTLLGSHLPEDVFKASYVCKSSEEPSGITALTSVSYSYKGRPNISHQEKFPDSYLIEEAQKILGSTVTVDQKTVTAKEKPSVFYQQALPEGGLSAEDLQVDQNIAIPMVTSASFSQREKPQVFYQEALSGGHLPGEPPGPPDQNTEAPTISPSSYFPGEESIIFYQAGFPGNTPSVVPFKVSRISELAEQKTNITTGPSGSYSVGEKSIIFYHQALPDGHLSKEASPAPADLKTGEPPVYSASCSVEVKPIIFYQQPLSDSPLTKGHNVSVVPGPTDQKTGIPAVPSTSQSYIERRSVSYQQEFPNVSEKALKVLGGVRSTEQKTEIPVVSSALLHTEVPTISSQEDLPNLTEEALQILGVAEEVPSVPSRDKTRLISYQKKLPDGTEVSLKSVGFGSTDQKTGAHIVSSSRREKSSGFHQQELPNTCGDALGTFHPEPVAQKVGKPTEPSNIQGKASALSPQQLPASHLTGEALKVSDGSACVAQTPEAPAGPSIFYFHKERFSNYQKASPDCDLTENSLKSSTVPGLSDQKKRPPVSSGSCSHKEKHKISAADLLDAQAAELPTVIQRSCLHREKLAISTVIKPDDPKIPLPTTCHASCAQKVKPVIFVQKQLSGRDQSEDIPKISTVSEPTVANTGAPVLLSSSYPYREKSDFSSPKELPDRHPAKVDMQASSSLGQADQISRLPTVPPGTYSHSEKYQLISEHVQELIDNLNSSESCLNADIMMPSNSQIDDGVIICKPESSRFANVGCEEIQDIDHGSKTLKEIQTLLMEAENMALKRCNFSVPLVPFRDVSDVSFVQSKKVVCFKETPTSDVCIQKDSFAEEVPHTKYVQKDIGTQTNLKYQRNVRNWEFISSATFRSPLHEANGTARVAFDENFRQYRATRSVMRSEPEDCSTGIGDKIIIPMMTIIKSDSSSDVSDGCCSWDNNLPESLESVSDVFLNFFPYTSPKTSITDSREEEGLSESEDGYGSADSLAAHVKYLLQCESSLNQAKQILKNAEEEEYRVRAQAWNLKFNLGRDYGYPVSELNEDDRRKVEEIKAKLFGHGRTTHVSEVLQSPRGIGCLPEAVCGHIIIESHEKGCYRTLTAEQPRPDSCHCVFRSVDPSDLIRGHRSPSSWRGRHINLSRLIDQSNPHFKIGNSFQLQSHPPFEKLVPDDIKISKGVGMPFHEHMDPQPSELIEPTCVPAKEMDFSSSSEILPSEPKKQFTTSITFSSHQHSKCISDSSGFKVDVTAGSQCTGPSLGVFKPHIPEEQISPRDLKQKISSPSSLQRHSYTPVTILVDSSRQRQKLPVDFEHSNQKGKLLQRSAFNFSHSEPSVSTNVSFKGVQFSGNDTIVRQDKLISTVEVKEKNVTLTPDLPSCIFLEQGEESHTPHTDLHMRKCPSPSGLDIASCIFLEQHKFFEQSQGQHVDDHEMREDYSLFPKCQGYIAADPSDFPDQQQCKPPGVDGHVRKQHYPLSPVQDCEVEEVQCIPQSYFSNMVNVEAKVSDMVSPDAPDHFTAASTPPSSRKALSCVRITLCPKTPSKLDSGTLDERFHSLDPASKTRINSEFNSDLRIISSRSLEPTSKLLTCKPVAQDQESLVFLGPKSPLDLQVAESSLPDSKTISQDLKTTPPQNSQIVTSRQTQVNISDLEEYSKPEGTPVPADGSQEQNKAPFTTSFGMLSSDAVTQVTTESPEKMTLSSEIFINADDRGQDIPYPTTQNPSRFASSSSGQQITASQGKDAQPVLLPYKPSGSSKMYYVPLLKPVPSYLDSKSDTTVESSHSGSNDAIAPDFPPQVLGTRDDDLSTTVNIKHKEGIYSKRAASKGKQPSQKEAPVQMPVTWDKNVYKENQDEIISRRVVIETAGPEEMPSQEKDLAGSSDITVQDRKTGNLPDAKSIKQKEGSLEIEPECHSEFANTTHSVFRSASFYFHHPVHLPQEQDLCHESSGRNVLTQHPWKDLFHCHSGHSGLPPPGPRSDNTEMECTRVKSLSMDLNLGGHEKIHTTIKNQARDTKDKRQANDPKKDQKVTPELTSQCPMSLNELWNKYQERQKQQKPSGACDNKELSLVERLDRLAKLLQNPITHSLQASESTQDDRRRGRGARGWTGRRQHQQKGKQQRKWSKSLERGHSTGDFRKSKVLSPHEGGKSSQRNIEKIKLDKYILRKQPDFNNVSNTSLDSRPSEESELLLTDSPNLFSSTESPVESDVLTHTGRDMPLNERSSSISTVDTARLIQAFGHDRLYLSPRQIKLYSSVTNQRRKHLEKPCKHKRKALNTACPQMTSEHTRRRHVQVANRMMSSDSVSSAGSCLSLDSTLSNEENVHMLNKGVQAGNLEIVTGAKKYTQDVGVTFPTPSSSEARLEEDSDMTSWSEEKAKEKKFLSNYLRGKNLRKNKPNPCEGVSWFVPVENRKSESKKENLPKIYRPAISWFEPVTQTKPWREPLREQNWQAQCMNSRGSLGGPGRDSGQSFLQPFVRATLQESLQLHRPDFISRSGERIKRLKLLVQERKLQNLFQNEREALFNTARPLPRRVLLAVQKNKPIGKTEMIRRTRRFYEQLPEVKKKREEEKRKSEYTSYRLRAQHYKMKVTNHLLGRKVPWD